MVEWKLKKDSAAPARWFCYVCFFALVVFTQQRLWWVFGVGKVCVCAPRPRSLSLIVTNRNALAIWQSALAFICSSSSSTSFAWSWPLAWLSVVCVRPAEWVIGVLFGSDNTNATAKADSLPAGKNGARGLVERYTTTTWRLRITRLWWWWWLRPRKSTASDKLQICDVVAVYWDMMGYGY